MKFKSDNKKKEINTYNWKILVVDDEPEVHAITKSVLKKFEFEDKGLDILSAYSGKEALEILKNNSDISLVLLDVVMETDDAGLKVAKAIREDLKNDVVRIVLRTGQPGSAPEKDVIRDYDINDYKEKTELTSSKLYTTVMASLRASRDIYTIKQNKIGLQKIIEASASIFNKQSLILFVEGVLTQVVSLLDLKHGLSTRKINSGFFATLEDGQFKLLATTGEFKDCDDYNIMTPEAFDLLNRAYEEKKSFFDGTAYVGFFESTNKKSIFLYLNGCERLGTVDRDLLQVFANNIAIAFENICLNDEILQTQSEIVETLGDIIEAHSEDTAQHVHRVAKVSYILAKAYGLSQEEANLFRMASPMHDVGKIAIADAIIGKDGLLTDEEYTEIKRHAQEGWRLLKGSNREIMKIAATIAYEHHEKWDGSGYPRGIKGKEIHIYGRITAIADVFDALGQVRSYKTAWPLEDILELFKRESGKHFEPKLVDLFFENLDEIKAIRND
ncbi:MAG: DUF3369 domain-containing protein [Arcobacteraceae bacterium]|nr:DUF3369 domain-containing protein [Arcobacteraceae bacterium]